MLYVAEGYAGNSVNTAVFRKNALCTRDSVQFIAFYDSLGVLTLGKRQLQDTAWQMAATQYKGNVLDAHRTISIIADDSAYLHVAFNHHNTPLCYTRSVAPYSLHLDTLMPMTGMMEQHVTYPEFYRMVDKLLFSYRDGASGRGNLIMNSYDAKTHTWTRLQDCLIDGENDRSAYWQICCSPAGTIHLSWVWRESWLVETNHDLCYACSHDGGHTWQQSDGKTYSLPITIRNAEIVWHIPQNSELINQTSITADKNDRPLIATYWRDSLSQIPQYRLVWHDGSTWQMQQVGVRTLPFSLSGGGTKKIPVARPQLVAYNNKVMYFVRDEEFSGMAAMYSGTLSKGKKIRWKRENLTEFSVNAWEPNLDFDLWQDKHQLALFLQNTMQGDGEKSVATPPQPVYVLLIE